MAGNPGRVLRLVAVSLLSAWLGGPAAIRAADAQPVRGVVNFTVPTARGPLAVHAYIPEGGDARAPVWVVMHGQNRDAGAYFGAWVVHARARRVLLVVPEFDKAQWPRSTHYPLGNVTTPEGAALPREDWAFTAVYKAVDEALRRAGREAAAKRVDLYGHGAGAQFVQRLVLHTGAPQVRLAIAANAGWYLLPDDTIDFPYGLRNLPTSDDRLREAFAAPLVVLLGRSDERSDGIVRRNAQADAQGTNRLSRGRYFLESSRAAAKRLGATLNWRMQEVEGAGHADAEMAPTVLDLLKDTLPVGHGPSGAGK